jgi:transposase
MWVPPEETDPVVLHAPTRKSVALFGAVNLRGGQMICHFNPLFEAQSFCAFLKALLRRRAHGKEMVVILDNAPYHHAAVLEGWLRNNRTVLKLLFLPPYSPELNPIERVWKLLRKLCTHNEFFPELELLQNALTQQLIKWWKPNTVLRRLCCIT